MSNTSNPFEEQAQQQKALLERERALNERAMRLELKREHNQTELNNLRKMVQEKYDTDDIFVFRDRLSKQKEENAKVLADIEASQNEFNASMDKIENELNKINSLA